MSLGTLLRHSVRYTKAIPRRNNIRLVYSASPSNAEIVNSPELQAFTDSLVNTPAQEKGRSNMASSPDFRLPTVQTGSEYLDMNSNTRYSPSMLSRQWVQRRSLPPPLLPLSKTPGPGARQAKKRDVFYQLGIDPLKEVNNSRLLCSFLTQMGKIESRFSTRLTQRSQRRLGKAIRRARHMGVIPFMSRTDGFDAIAASLSAVQYERP